MQTKHFVALLLVLIPILLSVVHMTYPNYVTKGAQDIVASPLKNIHSVVVKGIETQICDNEKHEEEKNLQKQAIQREKDEKIAYEEMVSTLAKLLPDKNAIDGLQFQGHGPEKGLYNFTVVTGMIDIGRGQWRAQRRSYSHYFSYLQRNLRLDVNFVVFADYKAAPFVRWMRRGRENRTVVIGQEFKDLPYYRYNDRMKKIMSSDEYKKDNELYGLAETMHSEYDILVLSKMYFMDRVVRENPFNTTYFVWLDAGYGHGEEVHPHDYVWRPKGMFEFPNQMTVIELREGVDFYEKYKNRLHKMNIAIIAALFFSGGGEVFKELYRMQTEELERWMKEGIADDEQTIYMLLYYRKKELFNLVKGNWFDVFKLFHTPLPGHKF